MMCIKQIVWWEYIFLFFKKGTWYYDANGCYMYSVYVKKLFGNSYILEESKEKYVKGK